MTISIGTFNVGTGAIGTTYEVASLAHRPSCVLFMWSGRSNTGSPTNHSLRWGDGFMLSDGKNYCVSGWEQDASDPFSTADAIWNNACIVRMNGAVSQGKAAFSAMLENGFRVIITEAFAASVEVMYIAISGVEFSAVEFTEPGSASVLNVSGAGIRPTFAKVYGTKQTAWNSPSAHSAVMLGAASGSSEDQQGVVASFRTSAAGHARGAWHHRRGRCIAHVAGDPGPFFIATRASLKGFTDDGAEFDFVERSAAHVYVALFATGRWFCFPDAFRTNTTPFTHTGMTWVPQALVVYGHHGIVDAGNESGVEIADDVAHEDDTTNHRSQWALHRGLALGASNRIGMLMWGAGGTLSNTAQSGIESSYVTGAVSDAAPRMDINSDFTPDTIEFVMDVADTVSTPGPNFFLAFAIGPPILEPRQRRVKYHHNTYASRRAGRLIVRDVLGREVATHELASDNWLFEGGPSFISPTKYASLLEDPTTFYMESIAVSPGRVKIETTREGMFSSILRRLAS